MSSYFTKKPRYFVSVCIKNNISMSNFIYFSFKLINTCYNLTIWTTKSPVVNTNRSLIYSWMYSNTWNNFSFSLENFPGIWYIQEYINNLLVLTTQQHYVIYLQYNKETIKLKPYKCPKCRKWFWIWKVLSISCT